MYERAATTPATTPDGGAGLGPIWHVEGARTFFAGPLRYNAPHRHGAPVFLAGLYGRFRLRIGDGDWTSCRTAMIPAGVSHELFLGGDPLGVLYVEPDLARPDGLVPLMAGTHHEGTALVGSGGETGVLRDLYEDRAGAREAGVALAGLLGYATVRSQRQVDARIARAISALRTGDEDALSAAAVARAVGLSASRFQHLFSEEVGVPFRRYRAWLRMRLAVRCMLEGGSLTMAAHEAGFYDQAHFAHDFRRTFGAPASGSLVGIRR